MRVCVHRLLKAVLALAVGFMLPVFGAKAAAAPSPITLTMWDIYPAGPTKVLIDNSIARFNEKFPYARVQRSSFAIADIKTKVATAVAADQLPDIFQTWGGGVLESQARQGRVLLLNSALKDENWIDRFVPAAMSFVTFTGKTYAVPIELAVVVMYYNKDLFARHNVTPPKTYSDLLNACRTFKAAGIAPIILGMSDAPWAGDFFWIYLVDRIGGTEPFRRAAARQASFTTPTFVEAGKKLQEMVDVGCFNEGFLGEKYANMRIIFAQEKAAMMLMGSWLPGQIAAEAPDFVRKLDFFLFPQVEGGKGNPTTVVGGTNMAYAVAYRTRYPREAIALLKELSSPATADELATVVRRLPATKYTYAMGKVDPITLKVAGVLAKASGVQLYWDQYLPPGLAAAHLDITVALFGKTITPGEAAARTEEAARKEFGR